jgi:hypothetical protein
MRELNILKVVFTYETVPFAQQWSPVFKGLSNKSSVTNN